MNHHDDGAHGDDESCPRAACSCRLKDKGMSYGQLDSPTAARMLSPNTNIRAKVYSPQHNRPDVSSPVVIAIVRRARSPPLLLPLPLDRALQLEISSRATTELPCLRTVWRALPKRHAQALLDAGRPRRAFHYATAVLAALAAIAHGAGRQAHRFEAVLDLIHNLDRNPWEDGFKIVLRGEREAGERGTSVSRSSQG